MKKVFLALSLIFTAVCVDAQRAGQVYLGLSHDVSHVEALFASVNPTVNYFVSDRVSVGGEGSWRRENGESATRLNLNGKYYLTQGFFGQVGLVTDLKGTNGMVYSCGYTGFVSSSNRFYFEPSVYYSLVDEVSTIGLKIGCGIRLSPFTSN